ncbi:hypothetical protein JKP88DRAFT_274920 [Tribonema minus]|uniref:IBR domain-containing protein n=1 Tax=Tribonema minus TaxID=303371 RepID=A0A835ZDW0_9STRA|nr:hypothetical protein JKP88DRAFT_274920 [Tribonema minus]
MISDSSNTASFSSSSLSSAVLSDMVACDMCLEQQCSGVRLPCAHTACNDCVARLFDAALADASLIPLRQVDPHGALAAATLSAARLAKYHRFYKQSNSSPCGSGSGDDSSSIKTSVSGGVCGSNSDSGGDSGGGSGGSCGGGSGGSLSSSEGSGGGSSSGSGISNNSAQADAAFAALMAREGWRRCARCGAAVELRGGCAHVTCRCRREFCYACGAAWKSCTCALWSAAAPAAERGMQEDDGGALLAAAQEGGAEEVPVHPSHLARAGLLVLAMRLARRAARPHTQRLQQRACLHAWHRSEPPSSPACANCGYCLRRYCYRCVGGCGGTVCYTCRAHRL